MREKELNFEDKLWKAADKLRKKVEVHEYKYVVLGLIFLRYLSFAFEEKKKKFSKMKPLMFLKSLEQKYVKMKNCILPMAPFMFLRRQDGII